MNEVEFQELFRAQKEGEIYKGALGHLERQLIQWALRRTRGNQLRASEILGINRNTLRAKMKKLGILAENVN